MALRRIALGALFALVAAFASPANGITLTTNEPERLSVGTVSPKKVKRGQLAVFRLVLRNDTDRGATFFTTSLSNGGLARRTIRVAPGSRFIIKRRIRASRRATSLGVRWIAVGPDVETFSYFRRVIRVPAT